MTLGPCFLALLLAAGVLRPADAGAAPERGSAPLACRGSDPGSPDEEDEHPLRPWSAEPVPSGEPAQGACGRRPVPRAPGAAASACWSGFSGARWDSAPARVRPDAWDADAVSVAQAFLRVNGSADAHGSRA